MSGATKTAAGAAAAAAGGAAEDENKKQEEDPGCELLFAGGASWSLVGRGSKPTTWDGVEDLQVHTFSRIKPIMGVPIRKVVTGSQAFHILAFTTDGKALIWGRNEDAQLGLGDCRNRYHPTRVPDIANAVDGCAGQAHTMIITREHAVYAAGKNEFGQCGVGRVSKTVSTFKPVVGGIAAVSCGAGRNFSVIVDSHGHLYSMGCPQYGQLGNGTEGTILEKAGKLTFRNESSPIGPLQSPDLDAGVKFKQVECGQSHSCAMDDEGRLYTWGFGGYGQLGHSSNKNELLPRAVAFFCNEVGEKPPNLPSFLWRPKPKVRATVIACGSSVTYAIANRQALYMWGITKRSGESTMQPEVFDGLSGWKCRDVATGNSATIVAAADSVITWGPGPTWGELAYGEGGPKSSTRTRKADCIEGVEVAQVAMGSNVSIVLVPNTKANAEYLANAPVLDQEELPETTGSAATKKRKAAAAAKKKKKKNDASDGDSDQPKKSSRK